MRYLGWGVKTGKLKKLKFLNSVFEFLGVPPSSTDAVFAKFFKFIEFIEFIEFSIFQCVSNIFEFMTDLDLPLGKLLHFEFSKPWLRVAFENYAMLEFTKILALCFSQRVSKGLDNNYGFSGGKARVDLTNH